MAQHDYIISNQTFPNTRADINNLASAIATNNSGTSAPSTQYAGQFWIDTTTTTWTLYIHDGSDDIQFATIDTSANTVNFIDSALDVVNDTTPQLGGDLDLNSSDITGTGNINITGTVTATSFSGDGSSLTGVGGEVVDDTTPQLGGNLDLNSNDITGTGNINITGTATVSGDLTVDTDSLYVDSTNHRVGINTTSPATTFDVSGSIYVSNILRNTNGGTAATPSIQPGNDSDTGMFWAAINTIGFSTVGTERMRIDSSGNVLVNTTDTSVYNNSGTGNGGVMLGAPASGSSNIQLARYNETPLYINRLNNDGTIVDFRQDGSQEGTISVSGSTVSYNGFTGTHWSRLSDNSKPTILKGTILESLDEMMDWYQVQFDVTDEEGNTTTKKQSYALGDGESVGDVITYTYEGTDYQATIIQEGDVKHTKSKISDTVDAKNVYGVFVDWDNDDDTVNDMYVAQTGTFVVRMNSAETVSKGDLIQSNGDGTGKVQADDLLRASTVAKVLSTTKIETYEDGSYIVPCSLHC